MTHVVLCVCVTCGDVCVPARATHTHAPPQSRLAEQTDVAIEATSRAEQLEEDLAGLRAQMAQVRRRLRVLRLPPLASRQSAWCCSWP